MNSRPGPPLPKHCLHPLCLVALTNCSPNFGPPKDFGCALTRYREEKTVRMKINRPLLTSLVPLLLVALPAILIIHTLYGGNWFESQEHVSYPIRVVEYLQNWKAGVPYARWCPDLYGGYGYPLFNWYPPGMCATAAALAMLLGIGPILALKLATSAFIIAGGLGVYAVVCGETARRDAALIAGLVYLFFPYRFTDLFLRGELTEFAAYSIAPFVIWGYRALLRIDPARRPLVGTFTGLAHAGVWFCHPVIAGFLSGIVAIILLLHAIAANDKRAALRSAFFAGCVAAFGTAIASIYLVPAILEQSLVRLDDLRAFCSPTTKYLVDWNWLLGSVFLGEYKGSRTEWTSGPIPSGLGMPTLVGALMLAVSLIVPQFRARIATSLAWWSPAILYLPLMVRNPLSVWFWETSPLGNFVLFPWRLLGFVGIFAAIGIGIMWATFIEVQSQGSVWFDALLAATFVVVSCLGANQAVYTVDPVPVQLSPPAIGGSGIITTVVANEYLPRTVLNPPQKPRGPAEKDLVVLLVNPPAAQTAPRRLLKPSAVAAPISATARRLDPLRFDIDLHAALPGHVDLRLFAFPGWHVETVSGPAKVSQSTSPAGLIRLFIPAAGNYHMVEYFGSTPLRSAAAIVSCLALLITYPALWFLGRTIDTPSRSLPCHLAPESRRCS